MGGVILLIAIIVVVSNHRNSGTPGDKKASEWGWISIVWLLSFSTWLLLYHTVRPASFLLLALLPIVLFPGVVSFILTQFGLVKVSYYLGRISFACFGRSPLAGALLRGYQATTHIKGNEKKFAALQWLRKRFLGHQGKVFSGEMVMFAIIDSMVVKPNDHTYLAYQLRLLNDIARESIPRGVSRLALRHALMPAIVAGDWTTVNKVANQWDTPASNYLAMYLREFHGLYIEPSHRFSKSSLLRYRLHIPRDGSVVQFAKSIRAAQTKSEQSREDSALARLWHGGVEFSPAEKERLWNVLTDPTLEAKWKTRAEQLGTWQPELIWGTLMRSVEHHPAFRQASYDLTEAEIEHLERQHKTLEYLGASVAQKLHQKAKSASVEEYLDWLKILVTLNELKSYKDAQLTAFSLIHQPLWNWVADLWNVKKDRCLVYFIATTCAPLARECGLKELHKVLSGLTSGEYR